MNLKEMKITGYQKEIVAAYRQAITDLHNATTDLYAAMEDGRSVVLAQARIDAAQATMRRIETGMEFSTKKLFGLEFQNK